MSLCSPSLDPDTVHLAFRYSLSMPFICLWFIHGYFKDLNFFLDSQQLLCCQLIVQCFTVSIHFKYIGVGFFSFNIHGSLVLFTDSTWLHLLSHLFSFTFMCLIIHRDIPYISSIIQCITIYILYM